MIQKGQFVPSVYSKSVVKDLSWCGCAAMVAGVSTF
jgi:hypothetical protein